MTGSARSKLLLGAGVLLLVLITAAGLLQGRSDARFDRLALRVDSLAVSLGQVVAAVEGANPAPAPQPDTIAVAATGLFRGHETAPVTMVEFLDYECPFCQRFHTETLPLLLDEYVETGSLKIVLRDNPLPMHENALAAALAARCAAEQDQAAYWPFSDAMLAAGPPLDATGLEGVAVKSGLDAARLSECMASGRHEAAIQADAAEAAAAGLTGTPMFIIGPSQPDGQVRGLVIRGAYPIQNFRDAIDGALAAASESES